MVGKRFVGLAILPGLHTSFHWAASFGSRRKVVFEEGPQQPALWEVWTEGPRSCGKTVFWFFHSSGTFHNAFADQFSFTLLAKLADLQKKRPRCAPRAGTWFHNSTRSRS